MLDHAASQFAEQAAEAGRVGTGDLRFESCVLTSPAGQRLNSVTFDQEAVWETRLVARRDVDTDIILGLAIFNVKGDRVAGVQNVHQDLRVKLKAGERTRASIKMNFPFTAEKYSARLTVMGFQDGKRTVNGIYDFNRSKIMDQVTDAVFFEVEFHAPFPIGPAVCLPGEITLNDSSSSS